MISVLEEMTGVEYVSYVYIDLETIAPEGEWIDGDVITYSSITSRIPVTSLQN